MKRRFVILNEVKNLIGSMSSVGEILRLHLRMTLRHSLFAGMKAFILALLLSFTRKKFPHFFKTNPDHFYKN